MHNKCFEWAPVLVSYLRHESSSRFWIACFLCSWDLSKWFSTLVMHPFPTFRAPGNKRNPLQHSGFYTLLSSLPLLATQASPHLPFVYSNTLGMHANSSSWNHFPSNAQRLSPPPTPLRESFGGKMLSAKHCSPNGIAWQTFFVMVYALAEMIREAWIILFSRVP